MDLDMILLGIGLGSIFLAMSLVLFFPQFGDIIFGLWIAIEVILIMLHLMVTGPSPDYLCRNGSTYCHKKLRVKT